MNWEGYEVEGQMDISEFLDKGENMADKMLIDGLIKFCDEKSKNIKLKAEPQVFVEIKQALEELRAIKSDGFTDHLLNMGYTKGIKDGYAKSIDEFAERLKDLIAKNVEDAESSNDLCCEIFQSEIDEIAEQMKAGGIDE